MKTDKKATIESPSVPIILKNVQDISKSLVAAKPILLLADSDIVEKRAEAEEIPKSEPLPVKVAPQKGSKPFEKFMTTRDKTKHKNIKIFNKIWKQTKH